MDRAQKEKLVSSLNQKLSNSAVIVVAHYAGLTVADMTKLRRALREAGGAVQVAKNRLVKRALEGTDVEGIADLFTGPTCIATSDDPVTAPKILAEFAKENDKLIVLGGAMGDVLLDQAAVNNLATLPSLDALRGKLVGLLQAPAGQIAQVVAAPGAQVARVLQAKSNAS